MRGLSECWNEKRCIYSPTSSKKGIVQRELTLVDYSLCINRFICVSFYFTLFYHYSNFIDEKIRLVSDKGEIQTQAHRTQSIFSSHTTPLPCPMKAWGSLMSASGYFQPIRLGCWQAQVTRAPITLLGFLCQESTPNPPPHSPLPLVCCQSSCKCTSLVVRQMGESDTYNWKYNLANSLTTVGSIVPPVFLNKPPPLLPLLRETNSILQGPLAYPGQQCLE